MQGYGRRVLAVWHRDRPGAGITRLPVTRRDGGDWIAMTGERDPGMFHS
jgi:hypothetical protein